MRDLKTKALAQIQAYSKNLVGIAVSIGGLGIVQFLRLFTNVILTRLLAPELFGIMAIVNSIRQGIAMMSDLGVNQSLIRSKNAENPEFYNTAWTMNLVYGVGLWVVSLGLALPAASFYGAQELKYLIPLLSLTIVLTALNSTAVAELVRRGHLGKRNLFDIFNAVLNTLTHIGAALLTPTIWAFAIGGISASIVQTIVSHFIIGDISNRIFFSRKFFDEIFSFGKWILVISFIAYAAMQIDRLYLGKLIPFALLGVYSISRSLAMLPEMVIERIGGWILFPAVSSAVDLPREELRKKLVAPRMLLLIAAAFGLSFLAAVSDFVVGVLFDERYQQAALMLPYLLIAVWMTVMCQVNAYTLLGLGVPKHSALADGAKFIGLIISIPVLFQKAGFVGVLYAIIICEVIRYFALLIGQYRERTTFFLFDLIGTVLFLASFFGFQWIRVALGAPDLLSVDGF